jgi:hypothetical protein
MGRGGYRPGAGRKKRSTNGMGPTAHQQLALGVVAVVDEGLGAPVSLKAKAKAHKIPEDILSDAAVEGVDPLTYMLRVLNDGAADPARRDRMAIACAPFVHPRQGDGTGKKKDLGDKARAASRGKFSPQAPPLRRVK